MIKLNVEEYCHKCQGTVIICGDKFRCDSIKSYLKESEARENHSPL